MAVLFLDPLALALLGGMLVYIWLVWRGTLHHWFGRSEGWTVLAWPIPLLAVVVPPVAGGLLWLGGTLGIEVGDGDVAGAALYAAVHLVPVVALTVWPPRWLLPGWARRRLTPLPAAIGSPGPHGTMPAVQAGRGHGSRARWVWRVDGVAGHVGVDGNSLRFQSSSGPDPAARLDVDEEMVAELRVTGDGELRLATPRGGWWSRGRLDIDLDEVDRIRPGRAVPWRRDGLVTVEVAGRRSAQLWVADIRQLVQFLEAGGGVPGGAGPDLRSWHRRR